MFEVHLRAPMGDGWPLATRDSYSAASSWIERHLPDYPGLSASDFVIMEV
jgi:hypothetical protein